MKFDSTIIESFARRLYARASWVVLRYWFLYTMVGGIAAATCYYLSAGTSRPEPGRVHRPGNAGVLRSGRHRGRQREGVSPSATGADGAVPNSD